MKRIAFSAFLMAICTLALAQASNDRRGYQGTVTSALTQTLRHEGEKTTKEESKTATDIVFAARAITIGDEAYDVVKREFDGQSTTTFTCTKRRGTFEIRFKAGESITVIDTSNPDTEVVYVSLTQK